MAARFPLLPDVPSPASRGFRMPAEWEPHAATWIAWPHQREDWPGKFEPIPWVYVEIVRWLHRSERVRLLVQPDLAPQARDMLARGGIDLNQIDFLDFPTDRVWLRDSGAIFVRDAQGHLAALDFHFNAWAKYDNWHADDALPEQIATWRGLPRWQPTHAGRRFVLEGGSIEVDGAGLLLTTEECLLSDIQARNPGLDRAAIESVLANTLGIRKVLWLHRGILGDDTHGHVDDLTRFFAPGRVVTMIESDPTDENHAILQENLDRLRSFPEITQVVSLPMPAPLYFDGQRIPASYANFYIANHAVLVPTFNDLNDRLALSTLADLFPDRPVVGIHAVDLVWGLGTLHCLTQQEPVGMPAPPACPS
ncbi:MAG: agmatine deiminase family protein [Gemmataceae bacterium]